MEGLSRASGAGYIIVKIPKSWRAASDPIPEPEPDGGDPKKEGFDEYKWPPLRVEEYAVVEQHLLKDRVSPVDAVLPELEKLAARKGKAARRLASRLEDKAYTDLRASKAMNKLSIEEVQSYIDTPQGVLFTMKICLQRFHPEITDKEVRRIFEWHGEEEIKRLRDVAQGADKLGNSTGQNEEPGALAATNGTGLLTGDGSIVGSPKPTDGNPPASTD
jgi:hypothetical protein